MAAIKFDDIYSFMDFLPILINLANVNPDLLSDEAEEFYSKIERKIKPELRKWFLDNPKLRQQLKRFQAGIENGENIVISIKADKQNENREERYLTEDYRTINETILKHMENNGV